MDSSQRGILFGVIANEVKQSQDFAGVELWPSSLLGVPFSLRPQGKPLRRNVSFLVRAEGTPNQHFATVHMAAGRL